MKMVAEYLEKALDFERLAALENDPELKASLMKQARHTENWPLTVRCAKS